MDSSNHKQTSFHTAGIVPVSGAEDEFGLDWSGTLMPLSPSYTAIEAAVTECAYIGCETVWVVCNDDIAPLLKDRLGDYVRNVEAVERGAFATFPSEAYIDIPIYYVPIHPRDRDKIDCYAWSILHGANVAYWMCRRLSRWLLPDVYYVSFPYGIYDLDAVRTARKQVKPGVPFYFSHKGSTVCDGSLLGFAFGAGEWRRARDVIKSNSKTHYAPQEGESLPIRKLPKEERNQSRDYDLKDVFRGADISGAIINELEWFYDLTTWDGYCKLISSPHRGHIERPSKLIFPSGKLNKIGENI